MDVQRIENVAIPTAVIAAGAGTAGYFIPKAVSKEGEITLGMWYNTAKDIAFKDYKLLREANKLDKYITNSLQESIDSYNDRHIKGFYNRPESELRTILPTTEEYERFRFNKQNKFDRNAIINFVERHIKKNATSVPTEEETQRFLEKFVRKHSKELEVPRKDGQPLSEAVKEYLKGKTAADVKEAFLPRSIRKVIYENDYGKFVLDTFDSTFDKKAMKFKSDEDGKFAEQMFKAAKRNYKLKTAAAFATVAGSIALAGSFIADRLANR